MIKDSNKLRLEAEEIIREEKAEWTQQQVAAQKARDEETYSADAGRDRTSLEQQIGRPIKRADLVRRIQALCPTIYYEQSKALTTRGGLYSKGQFICGMEHDISPEFSVMQRTDKAHASVQMRGWRSILAELIKRRYITEAQAEKAFGITRGAQSERWWQFVQ